MTKEERSATSFILTVLQGHEPHEDEEIVFKIFETLS